MAEAARTRGSAGAVAGMLLCAVWRPRRLPRRRRRTVADAGCLSCHRRPRDGLRVARGLRLLPRGRPEGGDEGRRPPGHLRPRERVLPGPLGARLRAVPPPPGRADEEQPDVHQHRDDRRRSRRPGRASAPGVVYASPARDGARARRHAARRTRRSRGSTTSRATSTGSSARAATWRGRTRRSTATGTPPAARRATSRTARGRVYRGGDPTMKGKSPHSRTHAMQGLPPMEACARLPPPQRPPRALATRG